MSPNSNTSNPIPNRRQRNHDQATQSLLDSARSIMRENGVAALSMQELARRAGMRAPSLYHYFASKNEIYDALFKLGFTLFDQHLTDTTQDTKNWQEELRRVFQAYMSFAIQNPDLYKLCFERPVPGFVPSDPSMRISISILEKYYQRAERYQSEMESGLSPQQTSDLFIAIMHGLTALHLANQPDLPIGQGRFGSLMPATLSVLFKAWTKG